MWSIKTQPIRRKINQNATVLHLNWIVRILQMIYLYNQNQTVLKILCNNVAIYCGKGRTWFKNRHLLSLYWKIQENSFFFVAEYLNNILYTYWYYTLIFLSFYLSVKVKRWQKKKKAEWNTYKTKLKPSINCSTIKSLIVMLLNNIENTYIVKSVFYNIQLIWSCISEWNKHIHLWKRDNICPKM